MTDAPVHPNLLDVLAFGELLKSYVDDQYRSRAAFARAARTTSATVTGCVKGRVGPPLNQLERWCDALKLRGKERSDFVRAAWRTKAWSQAEANPWLKHVEGALARSRRSQRAAREFLEWQEARIAQLDEAMRRGGLTPPPPLTDPPELPGPDGESEP